MNTSPLLTLQFLAMVSFGIPMILAVLSDKTCPFNTDSGKCCTIPFIFEQKVYTQCTADGSLQNWKRQWRNPWCPIQKQADGIPGHWCIRNANSCGGDRTSPAGVISSSNFPHGYKNDSECIWIINIPEANQITLNFTDLSLSLDQSCDGAYVQIYDGDNTSFPLLEQVCGTGLPSPIRSTGNRMMVLFKASMTGKGQGKGFRAYYDTGECGIRTYGGNGNGACCTFPFRYKGQEYNTCITKDSSKAGILGIPWCSVTSNYDRDKKRGLCVMENVACSPTRHFACNNNHWWKQCIDKTLHCDGNAECADRSDEESCPPMDNPYKCTIVYITRSSKRKLFVWKLGRKCGYRDRCPFKNATAHISLPCNISSWFKCHNGWCVPPEWMCDGKDDCGDRSDETVNRCRRRESDKKSSCSWTNGCKKWEKRIGRGSLRNTRNIATCVATNITTIPNYLPHSTTDLYIIRKKVKELGPYSFARYKNLERLNLMGNQIRKIVPYTFSNVNKLINLNLASNLLSTIKSGTFGGLRFLSSLDLRGNPIETIEKQGFYRLWRIRKLNLTNMRLKSIQSGAFEGMASLWKLDLSGNKNLIGLPLDIFDPIPLQYLKADRFEFCCIAKLSGKNCSAPKDLFSSCDDLMANPTLGVSIWVLGCIALIGNGFVLIWRLKTKSESKVHSLLLLNLAVSDFLMGIYMVVIGSVDKYYRGKYFIFNEEWKRSPLCQFCGFLSTVSCEASVFILTIMTVDRYVAIVHPLQNLSLKVSRAYKVLAAIWSAAFVLAFIPLTGIEYFKDFYARSGVCLPLHLTANKPTGWEYSVFVFLVLNLVSFISIFILYFVMFIKIKQSHQMTGTRQGSATAAIGSRMVFIVLTDFVCWIPIIVIGIASLLGMHAPPEVYAWVAVFVLPLNSALNPILYTISTTNFRRNIGATVRSNSKKFQGRTFTTIADRSVTETNRNVPSSTTRTTESALENKSLLKGRNCPSSLKKKSRGCCTPILMKRGFRESSV